MSTSNIFPRSYLFVPAHREKFFNKLNTSPSDCIIFDLEDAVPPQQKEIARNMLGLFIRNSDILQQKRVLLRTNPVSSSFFMADLEFACSHHIQNIVIPKVKTIEDLSIVSAGFVSKSGSDSDLNLYPLIETPHAIENVFEIASFPSCHSLIFGHEDYLDSINASDTSSQDNLIFARSRIVNAARAFHNGAIDSPYLHLHDQDGCLKYARRSFTFGFDGMLVLHPLQLEVVNSAYMPSSAQFLEASTIIEDCKQSLSGGNSITFKDGVFIAPPILKKAKKTVAKYLYFNKSSQV